jgi:hypothetical protein
LPFLRFARDKRGYETTALVHAFRGRHGRTRETLLYWFRTPPGVKVGRPALDEEAIRWIEEHNPDIDFDWQKILESTPPSSPTADDGKFQRRRGKTERRAPGSRRQEQPRAQQPSRPVQPVQLDVPPVEEAQEAEAQEEAQELGEAKALEDDAGMEGAPEQALEQLTHPDAEEVPPAAPSAVEAAVGREQLIRLRARYAELRARITEHGGDAARIEALCGQAEPLNPDSWVTADEVKKGLAEFDAKIRDLRAAMGLRPRRRSHRGGRRHRGNRPSGLTQTPGPEPSSKSSDNGEGTE